MTRNQSDFVMSSDRKIIGNCEVITKVDIGSYHKNLMRLKKTPKQKPLKLDLSVLENSVTSFTIEF